MTYAWNALQFFSDIGNSITLSGSLYFRHYSNVRSNLASDKSISSRFFEVMYDFGGISYFKDNDHISVPAIFI